MLRAASRRCFFTALIILLLAGIATAKGNADRTQFNRDIRVEEGESISEATCFNCNVYVRGKVTGDVTVFHGNIVVSENASVTGDVTSFLGDVRVDNDGSVMGDLTIFGGAIHRSPNGKINGDVTNFGNKPLTALMLLSPFIVLALIIALIVWLVQRNRRPAGVPVSPGGYR